MSDITYWDTVEYDKYYRERRRIKQWQFRCQIEAMSHEKNCVLTLTYDNDHLPAGGTLVLSDYQKFLKNLRKRLSPARIRFFGCGEYGSLGQRPHYHIIIFGWCPDDLVYFYSSDRKIKFFRSQTVADIWKNGYIAVCPTVKSEVIPYVCKYLQKFQTLPDGLLRPFITMSRRPGIGVNALGTHFIDIGTDKLYLNGKSCPIPRYYLDKLEQMEIMTSMYVDTDGSLEYVPVSIPNKDLKKFAVIHGINTRVQHIRDKRRYFWQNRTDCDRYIRNVKNFKQFSTERKCIKKQ